MTHADQSIHRRFGYSFEVEVDPSERRLRVASSKCCEVLALRLKQVDAGTSQTALSADAARSDAAADGI